MNWQDAFVSLKTLVAPSCIRTVVIRDNISLHCYIREKLDSTLASLPVHPLPALQLELPTYTSDLTPNNAAKYFPQMASRNLLRVVEAEENWFENFAGVD
ncbi:hypothetical protein B0H17DRAFT_1207838 [Mycena rosella]|uniref:Uncharacterized protein n=1 Tax=Mycena rosella TaxID=1033263 RepID=A0AAD7D2D9_MYCRO|nr:hypothetical protein B0H17DRAFT_1207838 [Mycena rosella]